jgi:biofilm protein TabA
MRYITNTKINNSKIKRLMIHDSEDGVYLFEYDSLDDGSSLGDHWFEDLKMAFESCSEDYGVDRDAWEEIPDPLEHCQQDWIEPVRVVGRQDGSPQWGRFEKLIEGEWVEFTIDKG